MSVSRDCPNFLSTSIISRTDKATNFQFCMHILSIDRNKSSLQISGKVAGGVCEDSRNFSGHPYIASRGRLCDTKAFLLIYIHINWSVTISLSRIHACKYTMDLYVMISFVVFLARDSIYAIARYMPWNVRPSVCVSVRHTGGSVKDG